MARKLSMLVIWAVAIGTCIASPILPKSPPQQQLTPQQRDLLIKELQNDLVRALTLKAVAEGVRLQEEAEERILEEAAEAVTEEPGPERQQHLEEVVELLKRDRRATEALSGLLGGSSGGSSGGGAEASATVSASTGGSDSGSILNLVGPLLGSSSAGNGDAGSSGSGSGLGSILGLVAPLLGSSSGGGGGGGVSGSASISTGGINKGAILNLITPLLASSTVGGDSSGGSGLSSILGLSNSSGGTATASADGTAPLGGLNIKSQIKGAKVALVGDSVQLLLRLKFGVLTKILNSMSNLIAAKIPADQGIDNLKYPS